jgi:hypothetical protein
MLILQDENSASIPYDGNKRQITFIQNPGKLIYCNYPEALLTSDVLGDNQYGHHYLNKAEVKKGDDCQLVASHSNRTSLNMKYGIQFYNGSQSEVTLKISNIGFRALPPAEWDTSSLEVWNDFFQSAEELHSVPPNGSKWIFGEDVPPNYYLNAVMRFEADGDLECCEYVYLDINNIDGYAQLYPWDNGELKVYRGTGSSYFITTDIEIKISELPCLISTNTKECNNTNEMIEIIEPSDNSVYSKENGANLGNWGIEYKFNITIINDTNTQKNIIAYVGADQGQLGGPRVLSVINLGGKIGTCCSEANQSWNWAKEDPPISAQAIEPPYKYQYIHANNSCGPSVHMWRLDD